MDYERIYVVVEPESSGEALLQQAPSIPDAAYRFCRDEPGVHVVLSGTGNVDHLTDNLRSFQRPPLPAEATQRLRHIFRNVVSTTGQTVGPT